MTGEMFGQFRARAPGVDRLFFGDRHHPDGPGTLQDRQGIGHRPCRRPAEVPSHADDVERRGPATLRLFRKDEHGAAGAEYNALRDIVLKRQLLTDRDHRDIVQPGMFSYDVR